MDFVEIGNIIFSLAVFIACFAFGIFEGFTLFHEIYPTRYGKDHVEMKGKVVGEKAMKVGAFGSVMKIPVVQFDWKGTSYEIADKTSHLSKKYEIGDNVIVCYNPKKNKDIAIIKRGTLAYGTFLLWLQWFLIAIGAYICIIVGILLLI